MKPLVLIAKLGLLLLPILFILLPVSFSVYPPLLATVSARENEDEEDEEDHEEEDDEDEREDDAEPTTTESAPKTKTIKVIKEVVDYRPVTETIMVTEEAYAKDTDGDALVDALDPDPLLPQSEYFTDIDGDGIPNALDRHHDEDDFAYYELETDTNGNGIFDSYEEE